MAYINEFLLIILVITINFNLWKYFSVKHISIPFFGGYNPIFKKKNWKRKFLGDLPVFFSSYFLILWHLFCEKPLYGFNFLYYNRKWLINYIKAYPIFISHVRGLVVVWNRLLDWIDVGVFFRNSKFLNKIRIRLLDLFLLSLENWRVELEILGTDFGIWLI